MIFLAIYSPSCSRRRHFWSLQAEKTKCIHNSTACFVFVGLALACWLLSMLAKRSMPREKFGSSSLVSSIDYRKVQQQELAAKLDGNFCSKMQLHTTCYIRTAVRIFNNYYSTNSHRLPFSEREQLQLYDENSKS